MGFCGADIKALCAEAALVSLRRCYPQVYSSEARLDVDPTKLVLRRGDFAAALAKTQASSKRTANGPLDGVGGTTGLGKSLDEALYPLLARYLISALESAKRAFPAAAEALERAVREVYKERGEEFSSESNPAKRRRIGNSSSSSSSVSYENEEKRDGAEDEEEVARLIRDNKESWVAALTDAADGTNGDENNVSASIGAGVAFSAFAGSGPTYFAQVHIDGPGKDLVALGLLHYLSVYPQYSLSLPAVIAGEDSSLSPEQALTRRLQAAYAKAPSVVYLPDWKSWSDSVSHDVSQALINFLHAADRTAPVLWVWTGPDLLGEAGAETAFFREGSTGHSVSWQMILPKQATEYFLKGFFVPLLHMPAQLYRARKAFLLAHHQSLCQAAATNLSDEQKDDYTGVDEGEGNAGDDEVEEVDKVYEIVPRKTRAQLAAEASGGGSTTAARSSSSSPLRPKQQRLRSKMLKLKRYTGKLDDYPCRNMVSPRGNSSSSNSNSSSSAGSVPFPPDPQVDDRDAYHLRELRNFLRLSLQELHKDRRYLPFWRPVDPEAVLDYYDVVSCPMDLETMRGKVDEHLYPSLGHFLRDLDQIVFNAKEYNPRTFKDQRGRAIVSNAHSMEDVVQAHAYRFKKEVGYDLFKRCTEIVSRRAIPFPPEPQRGDTLPPEHEPYYSDVLEVHEELKEDMGEDHPTAIKEQHERERKEKKAERARQRLEREMEDREGGEEVFEEDEGEGEGGSSNRRASSRLRADTGDSSDFDPTKVHSPCLAFSPLSSALQLESNGEDGGGGSRSSRVNNSRSRYQNQKENSSNLGRGAAASLDQTLLDDPEALFKRKRREQLRAEREKKKREQEEKECEDEQATKKEETERNLARQKEEEEEEKENREMAVATPAMDIDAEGEGSMQPKNGEQSDKPSAEKVPDSELTAEPEPMAEAEEEAVAVVEAPVQKSKARVLTPEEIEALPSMQTLRKHMVVMNHLSVALCSMLDKAAIDIAVVCPQLRLSSSSPSSSTSAMEMGSTSHHDIMPNVVRHFGDLLDLKLTNGVLKEDFNCYVELLTEHKQLLRSYHDNLDLDQLDEGLRNRLHRYSTL